jgi:eukaryotic-like serine/threonine-protein kinase
VAVTDQPWGVGVEDRSLPSGPDRLLGHRYELHEPIGRGGMAVVFRATDRLLDRDVAVKILEVVSDERFRLLIRSEAKAAGRLSSPRVAHIYDYGEIAPGEFAGDEAAPAEDSGHPTPYLVMELVHGRSLSERLALGTEPRTRTLTGPDPVPDPPATGRIDDARVNVADLRGEPLPWREATTVAAQIAEGLAAAHAHGLVHRDI